MAERCPYCLEDLGKPEPRCARCDEPLTPEAEMSLAPPHLVARRYTLIKARGKAQESLSIAVLSVICFPCWWFFASIAVGVGIYAIYQHRKVDEKAPWQAIAGIVIGGLVLLTCGGLMLANTVFAAAQRM